MITNTQLSDKKTYRLIHCADVHLDSTLRTHLEPAKAKERNDEIRMTFLNMISYAADHEVDGILIAGDLFDTKNVSAKTRNLVVGAIEQNPDITFYYLKGNHDADGFINKLETIPENLKLFGDTWTSYVLCEAERKIVLTGIELCKENVATADTSLMLGLDDFNVVTMHGQDAVYKSRDKAETISIDAYKNHGIDYLALGHVHTNKYETLDGRGMYCYPGCLEGRGFDECGEHGFNVLDIDAKTGSYEICFVPMARRNLYEVPVDITGLTYMKDISEKVKEALSDGLYQPKDMIKVVLKGEVPFDCELDTDFLKKQFEDDYYFIKAKDKTKLLVDYSRYQLDKSLKGEFVRRVQAAEDLSEDEKAIVIKYGILALSGEEI